MEFLRVRTLQRMLATFLLLSLVVVLTPLAVRVGIGLSRLDRGGGLSGLIPVVVWLLVVGYYCYRLARAAYRFGNGEHVRRTEFVGSVMGIVGVLAISALITQARLGRLP